MKVCYLVAFALITAISILHCREIDSSFEDYKVIFGKTYANEAEHLMRSQIFNANLEKIRAVNENPKSTWRAGVNHLTDLTEEELRSLRGLNRDLLFSMKKPQPKFLEEKEYPAFPESVDWREKGVVEPVKNQGGCGSCWTFSATATLESHVAINTGTLLNLSEQELVACVENPHHCGGKGGCEGATQELAFEYIAKNGLTLEKVYPYQAQDTTCKAELVKQKAVITEGFVKLPENDYNALMNALAFIGPIAISLDASQFYLYHSGVFNGMNGNCGTTVNHAVVAVGYGVDKQYGPYWIVRNSWGPDFGEKGYIRIAREKDASVLKCGIDSHPEQGSGCDDGPKEVKVCGTCAILSDSSYPTGAKLA